MKFLHILNSLILQIMKNFKLLIAILLAFTFQSCFKDEADPLPTSGENSFSAKIDGKQFVAEDVTNAWHNFNGIEAFVRDNNWLLTFSNSSDLIIFISLHQVEEVGYYTVGIDENFFFDGESNISSVSVRTGKVGLDYRTIFPELNEMIEVNKIDGDSIIIGGFDKITLSDPDNPEKKVILTDGRFNINLATLNKDKDL